MCINCWPYASKNAALHIELAHSIMHIPSLVADAGILGEKWSVSARSSRRFGIADKSPASVAISNVTCGQGRETERISGK
jgi:hypothetical protein